MNQKFNKKPRRDFRTPIPTRIVKEPPKKIIKLPEMKLFGKWESKAEITDPGLSNYIDLRPIYIPRSAGVYQKHRFHKSKMHIVERLVLHMMVPGHVGKRHRRSSGDLGGNYTTVLDKIEKALTIIEEKTKKNPIEVLVKAIENGAVTEEIMTYQLGSIMARDAVITAPQRRVDKVLRTIAQGSYKASFKKKTKIENALAKEIISGSENSSDSHAIKERERVEAEASGTR